MEEFDFFNLTDALRPSFYCDALFEQYEPIEDQVIDDPAFENLYPSLAA